MDDDTPVPQYLKYFDVSSAGFPFREPRPDEIVRRRADMNDKFIFDILLASGGIEQPEALHPPTNVEDLEALLLAIEGSTYDILKKDCLVFYLLKWHQDGREEKFQLERCIPPQFTALADAYWNLDTDFDVPRAVTILSDNRLNREFVSKILHAISISAHPSPLIVQYVRTAKPLLTAPQDVWTYTLALADLGFLEAWRFQRTFNETEELRKQLLEKLLEWCISPEPRPQALSALLCFPLSAFEEKFVHEYALEPPKSLSRTSIAMLRDLICVRLIQSGKYADAIKVDHQFASSTLNESKSSSQERRKMVQDLYAALPQAERTLLDTELEKITQGKQTQPTINGIPKPTTTKASDISISQSWEEIPRPQPSPNGHVSPFRDTTHPPTIPLPERSGAPRFGGPILVPSTSSATAAPIIPVSKPAANAPRQSFPSTSSTSRPRASLGHAPAQFFSDASTGSASQPFTASSLVFSTASRKPNAFYTPPPAKPQGVKRGFDVAAEAGAGMDVVDDDQQMDVEHEKLHEKDDIRSDVPREERALQGGDLGFSVFGNGPGPVRREQTQTRPTSKTTRTTPPEKASRRVPPGAFMSDEEDGGDEDEPAPAPPPTRTRTSTRQTTTERGAEPPRNKRVKRVQNEEDLGRSLPGTLMEEEEEGEGEEADYVAPLRQPSPPRRAARAGKARSTTPMSDIGDEEGVTRRRRSSRLSTVSGVSQEPSPPKKTTGKGRKSAKAASGAATKRKR